jgi:hypothetical protein
MIYNLSLVDDIRSQFTNTIPTQDLLLSLLVGCISAIIINFIYKKTFMGVNYTKSFSLSIILLTLITSIVIRTINSNLSLSLGMVGALSIVRFRTSVKDPVDTIFMFWAITAGIMSGAGLYIITILSTIIIGLVYFVCYIIQHKKDNKKLLVINVNSSFSDNVINMLKDKKCTLKTESYKNNMAELTFEAQNRKQLDEIIKLKDSPDVISLNIIDVE